MDWIDSAPISRMRDQAYRETKPVTDFNIEWDAHFGETINTKQNDEEQAFPASFDNVGEKTLDSTTSIVSIDFDPFSDVDDKASIDALIT